MKEVSLDQVKKNLTYFIGKGTKLQFSNKDEWYYFDNFAADTTTLFCKKEDGSWVNRKIDNITKIYNTAPIVVKKTIAESEVSELKDKIEQGTDIEAEHAETFRRIKAYFDTNGKVPSKEQMAEWIASDHIREFENYYAELDKMEDYLKADKKIKPLKEHTITNDKHIDSIKDNFKPMIIEDETIPTADTMDVDQEVAPEPEVADLEKKDIIITTRQTVEGLIGDIENTLLDQETLAQLPPKANTTLRLNTVLIELKALRNDLDSYSKIIQETLAKEGKLISKVKEESTEEDTQEKDDDNKNDKEKGLLLGYKKADVEAILESNYKVLAKDENTWKISVRNTFRESTDSLMSCSLNVFFDDNCLIVNPNHLTESTDKLADKIYGEIYEDLKTIKKNQAILRVK